MIATYCQLPQTDNMVNKNTNNNNNTNRVNKKQKKIKADLTLVKQINHKNVEIHNTFIICLITLSTSATLYTQKQQKRK